MNGSVLSIESMLADLEYLVSIESPSHDIEAITRSAGPVRDVIERRLGHHAELVESAAGPHVHARFGQASKVLIVGHHDTVFPLGALDARPFSVKDGKVTGPGVFDMKGGIVLAGPRSVAARRSRRVELLITADEEVGSKASRCTDRGTRACLRSSPGDGAQRRWRGVENGAQGHRHIRGGRAWKVRLTPASNRRRGSIRWSPQLS